ncbi:hypothetical protein D3C78_1027620 [compost metagenome]
MARPQNVDGGKQRGGKQNNDHHFFDDLDHPDENDLRIGEHQIDEAVKIATQSKEHDDRDDHDLEYGFAEFHKTLLAVDAREALRR